MSAAPGTGGADAPQSKPNQMSKNCWSCSVISGGGLILSGAYVYNSARKVMGKGGHASIGVVAQIMFSAGLAAWGIVILSDPLRKSHMGGEAPPSN